MRTKIPRAVCLALALLVAGPAARAETEAEKQQRLERERKAREESLFGNIGKVADAQTDLTKNAQLGNRNASALSNMLGRNSIRSGLRHIRHGRMAKNRPEVRLGYFEVAQGILGLLAAVNASKLSDVSGQRAAGLVSEGGVASGPGAGSATSGPGAQGGVSGASSQASSAASWKQIASDLETDDAKNAFREIEEEYGITKKELLAELRAGRDGVDLLENARTNAEARDEALAALKEAREKAEKAAAAAAPVPEGGGRSLASLGASVLAEALASDSAYNAAAVKARSGVRDELKRRLAEMPDELEGELSPEVQEALRAREAERAAAQQREARLHFTIFDMVRAKYAEREGMIRGWIKSPTHQAEN